MKRRTVLVTLTASAALGGCGILQRTADRPASDGIIMRPSAGPSDKMMELLPDGDTVYISGTINADSAQAFQTVQAAHPALRRAVFLDADGPSGGPAGMALGRALRAAGMQTHLRNDSRVSGAAVDAYLGGTVRTLEDGATVGAVKGDAGTPPHVAYVTEMTGGDGYARYASEFGGRRRPRPMTIAEIGAMGLISGSQDGVLAAN